MNKYHNRKVTEDGYTFDSIAEYNRYRELKIMQNNGDIQSLVVHPSFLLQEPFDYNGKRINAIRYEADFSYIENGAVVVEDVKGVQTDVFRIKEKMFKKQIANHLDMEFRLVQA